MTFSTCEARSGSTKQIVKVVRARWLIRQRDVPLPVSTLHVADHCPRSLDCIRHDFRHPAKVFLSIKALNYLSRIGGDPVDEVPLLTLLCTPT